MKRVAWLFFWWFFFLGNAPYQVGPFYTEDDCKKVQAEVVKAVRQWAAVTDCFPGSARR